MLLALPHAARAQDSPTAVATATEAAPAASAPAPATSTEGAPAASGTENASGTEEINGTPADAAKYWERGRQLTMDGRFEDAVFEFRRAVLIDPTVAGYHSDLGEVYRRLEQYRLAIQEFERAIELDPNMADAYTSLGVLYDSQDILVKAVECHRKALKVPNNPRRYVAFYNLGHAYDRLGLIKAAMANYQKAIDMQYNFSVAYDGLGTDLMNLGRTEEGIDMIIKAISYSDRNDPQFALYYNDLGSAYAIEHDLKKAYDAFKRAADIVPRDAPFYDAIQENFKNIKEYSNGK